MNKTDTSNGPLSMTDPSESTSNADAADSSTAKHDADPIFQQEQQHLSNTYATLESLGRDLARKMEIARREAEADKRSMAEELSPNFATDDDALETYADFATMNSVIDGYNIAQGATAEKLSRITVLLKQPYFAKIKLQFKHDQPAKELYIGNTGVSDENYRRIIVDWRSPVAEVYYNQAEGRTSYVADGRTIETDLQLRRQFDISGNVLNAYFDTSVAIQDALLLASLSQQRTSQMRAITATIQREQNTVVRHDDVPVLLVGGIAGSGKTSVLLQRIAYLFYQMRETLDASEVFLITPNPVFGHYIENVLPELGERNPETMTWDDFARPLLPHGCGTGSANAPLELLERIDDALKSFEFDQHDFKDIRCKGDVLLSLRQVQNACSKFKRIPAGPHRVTLIREELAERLESRFAQLAASETLHNEIASFSMDEQLRLFHTPVDTNNEQEMRDCALRLLNARYADAFGAVNNDEWLRVDRIAMRLLGVEGLAPVAWLYFKMGLTGLSNADAKYVMIDEVQDYTAAQLAVMARYFKRAHFFLLGDRNQAISAGCATIDQIRGIFAAACGQVKECRLMTSYRSTPQITNLFASLLSEQEKLQVSSVQRVDEAPVIIECQRISYPDTLARVIEQAHDNDGLTAVIAANTQSTKRLAKLLGDKTPTIVDSSATLPSAGTVLITLKLAKGLEFDHVIVPDASADAFPEDDLSRRRLYTTISRATRSVALIANGKLTPLLK